LSWFSQVNAEEVLKEAPVTVTLAKNNQKQSILPLATTKVNIQENNSINKFHSKSLTYI